MWSEHVETKLLQVGFGNVVVSARILAILVPDSAPNRRLREEARQESRLIDATQGRKTRSMVLMDTGHVILSAVQFETLAKRFEQFADEEPAEQ